MTGLRRHNLTNHLRPTYLPVEFGLCTVLVTICLATAYQVRDLPAHVIVWTEKANYWQTICASALVKNKRKHRPTRSYLAWYWLIRVQHSDNLTHLWSLLWIRINTPQSCQKSAFKCFRWWFCLYIWVYNFFWTPTPNHHFEPVNKIYLHNSEHMNGITVKWKRAIKLYYFCAHTHRDTSNFIEQHEEEIVVKTWNMHKIHISQHKFPKH